MTCENESYSFTYESEGSYRRINLTCEIFISYVAMEKFISEGLFIFKCKLYVKFFLRGSTIFEMNTPKHLLTDLNERENSGNVNQDIMSAAGKMF